MCARNNAFWKGAADRLCETAVQSTTFPGVSQHRPSSACIPSFRIRDSGFGCPSGGRGPKRAWAHLHLLVDAVVQQQVVRHANPMGLHGMALRIQSAAWTEASGDKEDVSGGVEM